MAEEDEEDEDVKDEAGLKLEEIPWEGRLEFTLPPIELRCLKEVDEEAWLEEVEEEVEDGCDEELD